ncbi:hypothetical protein LCGC14_1057570 [marine sediment metagenome]|uniref:Uncharacterized protein n=1 Tax=marine sediment metagenome TaxID=412755 RepID=A0A0F9Q539_9ZZZZ
MIHLFIAMLVGLMDGIVQAMIMSKSDDNVRNKFEEGVRGHTLFPFYHFIFGLFLSVFAVFVIITWNNKPTDIALVPQYICTIIGLLCFTWIVHELTYTFARYGKLTLNGTLYEHLVLFDFFSVKLYGWQVVVAHIIRLILGVSFLMIGDIK